MALKCNGVTIVRGEFQGLGDSGLGRREVAATREVIRETEPRHRAVWSRFDCARIKRERICIPPITNRKLDQF